MASGSNKQNTWQVTAGCKYKSPGCVNCYAEVMAKRLRGMARADVAAGRDPKGKAPYLHVLTDGGANDGKWNGTCVPIPENLAIPLGWKKPRMVFVDSMSDLFHEDVPFEFIDRVFAVMASCGRHTFQVLTKRPHRMAEYLERVEAGGHDHANLYQSALIDYYSRHGVDLSRPYQIPERPTPQLRFIYDSARGVDTKARMEDRPSDGFGQCHWRGWPLSNVWLGTSCEDQKRADERVPELLKCPAVVRFLSCEPLIGPIDLRTSLSNLKEFHIALGEAHAQGFVSIHEAEEAVRKHFSDRGQRPLIDWVIVGGESGAGDGIRPCNVEWVRSIVGQCKAAGVACFVKQLGSVPVMSEAAWKAASDGGRTRLLSYRNHKRAPAGTVSIAMVTGKGGDVQNFPEDLRVREMPVVGKAVSA